MGFNLSVGALPGPYHLKKGIPSQDYWGYLNRNNVAIIAVADGAGSHRLAEHGAKFCVDLLIELLEEKLFETDDNFDSLPEIVKKLDEDEVKEVVFDVHSQLHEFDEFSEMGCTLAVVVMDESQAITVVVGDAFAVLHDEDGTHHLIQQEQIGEFVNLTELMSNETIHPVSFSSENIVGASVSSDGLEHLSIDFEGPTPNFWNPLLNRLKRGELNAQSFVEFLDNKDLLDDDTTLVMAVRID